MTFINLIYYNTVKIPFSPNHIISSSVFWCSLPCSAPAFIDISSNIIRQWILTDLTDSQLSIDFDIFTLREMPASISCLDERSYKKTVQQRSFFDSDTGNCTCQYVAWSVGNNITKTGLWYIPRYGIFICRSSVRKSKSKFFVYIKC